MTTIPSGFSIDSYPVDTSSSVFSELERSAGLMNTQTATSSQAVSIAKQEMALNKTNFWVSHFGHDAIRGTTSGANLDPRRQRRHRADAVLGER